MSMDLTEDCPHCGAKVGEICTEECEVNGEKIQALQKALWAVDLSLKNITQHWSRPTLPSQN